MARQTGEHRLKGIYDDIDFYYMDGKAYARTHNPVTTKRFWKDAAFEGSRRSSARLARGSQIASEIYRGLPTTERVYSLFCELKKKAIALLKGGEHEAAVRHELIQLLPKREAVRRRSRGGLMRNSLPLKQCAVQILSTVKKYKKVYAGKNIAPHYSEKVFQHWPAFQQTDSGILSARGHHARPPTLVIKN